MRIKLIIDNEEIETTQLNDFRFKEGENRSLILSSQFTVGSGKLDDIWFLIRDKLNNVHNINEIVVDTDILNFKISNIDKAVYTARILNDYFSEDLITIDFDSDITILN